MILIRKSKEDYGAKFDEHLIEQYKLYVDLVDGISARRMLANSFFVGVHTALIMAFAVMLKEKVLQATLPGSLPFLAVILLCFVWWQVVHSYRQLNSAKFRVIHALEQMLPAAPFTAEWLELGEGKDPKRYVPLTYLENWVPVCFGILYVLLAATLYFKA